MIFNYKYSGSSVIQNSNDSTAMNFVPDALRSPTFFVGDINQHIPYREAMSALHDVVISDLRYTPKNKDDYQAWLAEQEKIWLAEEMQARLESKAKLESIRLKLADISQQRAKVMGPYYKARDKYFKYLYITNKDLWWVLDPVITVHPDQVFFECFSQDESTYARLSCNYNMFKNISDKSYGTTNIDYSADLYNEFQKIRDYKNTSLSIDPSGFDVKTEGEDAYNEVKIDLPESWVKGFLQVSSAMALPSVSFTLDPIDIYNFCFILKRNKEKKGPRSIRFILKPGHPVKAIFEPWNIEVECTRSIYKGDKDHEIRIWGRRRLLTLERLIPIAKSFQIHLMGNGMPSFWVADLGDMYFTLGLSGWTANDWSKSGNFDLMVPHDDVDALSLQKIYSSLKEDHFLTINNLAQKVGMNQSTIFSALTNFTQEGKVVYDLKEGVYRLRELSNEEIPVDSIRFANERESLAAFLIRSGKVNYKVKQVEQKIVIEGNVQDQSKVFSTQIILNEDEILIDGSCECNFFKENRLRKGPCEHILATRSKQKRQTILN